MTEQTSPQVGSIVDQVTYDGPVPARYVGDDVAVPVDLLMTGSLVTPSRRRVSMNRVRFTDGHQEWVPTSLLRR